MSVFVNNKGILLVNYDNFVFVFLAFNKYFDGNFIKMAAHCTQIDISVRITVIVILPLV